MRVRMSKAEMLLKRLARKEGLPYHRKGPFRQTTMYIEPELIERLDRVMDALGWKKQDAVNDAIEMWLERMEPKMVVRNNNSRG